jgi:UDP:flavonoid glycosyltransferase YjiC (YdhE family)
MTRLPPSAPPRILLFNINGSGLGHLSRCLAYAHRLRDRAKPVFFSLASALDVVHDMGFEGDYFVSPFWSRTEVTAWNRELAVRVGLMLEETRPAIVVFDGTWPFKGLMDACDAYGVPRRVWSNRGLHKPDFHGVPVDEGLFDLVIEPGEFGTPFTVQRAEMPGRKVTTPPVTLLGAEDLLDRGAAREALGLDPKALYALFSLGPGNLKDVGEIGRGLIDAMRAHGYIVAWAQAPITVRDVPLPDDVLPISVFPLVRYMRAFDVFAGAAGYNTCCEVLQSGVPSLLVPNTRVADDQARRAHMIAAHAPVVVSPCEEPGERADAVERLLALSATGRTAAPVGLDGAERAAEEILALLPARAAA